MSSQRIFCKAAGKSRSSRSRRRQAAKDWCSESCPWSPHRLLGACSCPLRRNRQIRPRVDARSYRGIADAKPAKAAQSLAQGLVPGYTSTLQLVVAVSWFRFLFRIALGSVRGQTCCNDFASCFRSVRPSRYMVRGIHNRGTNFELGWKLNQETE